MGRKGGEGSGQTMRDGFDFQSDWIKIIHWMERCEDGGGEAAIASVSLVGRVAVVMRVVDWW